MRTLIVAALLVLFTPAVPALAAPGLASLSAAVAASAATGAEPVRYFSRRQARAVRRSRR